MKLYYEHYPVAELDVAAGCFRYDPAWQDLPGAFAVSSRFPLTSGDWPADEFIRWAAHLIHDNSCARMLDDLAGEDVAGGVVFGPDIASEAEDDPLDPEELAEMLRLSAHIPAYAADGAKDEFSTVYAAGIASHLLYADRPWGRVQSDALCMSLARRLGIDVAQATTGIIADMPFLKLSRTDRRFEGTMLRRLHQETFAQAMLLAPGAHASDTTFAHMMGHMRLCGVTADLFRIWDARAFHLLCGNAAVGPEHFSLRLDGRGCRLAPMSHASCPLAWPKQPSSLALPIGGERDPEALQPQHWKRETSLCGIGHKAAIERIRRMAFAIHQHLPEAVSDVSGMPAGPHAMLRVAAEAITARASLIVTSLK